MALSENLDGKTKLSYRVLDAVGGVLDISERFARTIGDVLREPVTSEFGRRGLAKGIGSGLANSLAGGINGVNHRLNAVNEMLFGAKPE